MNNLKAKLKSESGASMVIALAFLMMIMMIASLIINAAAFNATKAENRTNDEQLRIYATSVAEMIADELEGKSYAAKNTKTTHKCGTCTTPDTGWSTSTAVDAFFADYVNSNALKIVKDAAYVPSTKDYTIAPSSAVLNGVGSGLKGLSCNVRAQMNSNYSLIFRVTCTASNGSEVVFVVSAAASQTSRDTDNTVSNACRHKQSTSYHWDSEEGKFINWKWVYYDKVETTSTKTVTWPNAVISQES